MSDLSELVEPLVEPPDRVTVPEDPTGAVETAPVTIEQLAVTLGIGLVVLVIALLLFAAAVRLRVTNIAPRCEARPRDVIYNPDPNCEPCQNRGNPFLLGWVFWSLRLSYHEMLDGVKGTGTRNGGLTGHLLNVNLDGIVLLRFHAMALRIAGFAMFVYCFICLPLYRTARCYEDDGESSSRCNITSSYNLTRYEKLTLANVPSLNEVHAWDVEAPVVTFRLYMVVVCSYLVCWFTCFELHKEWVDLLAMRRVYYLEHDHWKHRREQLKATMLSDHGGLSSKKNSGDMKEDDNPHLHQRPPWIPHPEQRDTPPSIELYSVLVGGLPKRPQQVVSDEDLEAAMSDMESTGSDWQLAVTAAFFDYCVPNQPGYSSSVAAVTILPSASELAKAWKKWYQTTKAVNRLRFIRRTLLERGHSHNPLREEEENGDDMESPAQAGESDDNDDDSDSGDDEIYMRSSSRRAEYINHVLGDVTDNDVEGMFLRSLQMGPEQTAAYSMELSKGSSKCCPHGCCEEKILWSNTQKLLEMEKKAVLKAKAAFMDLELARERAAAHEETHHENKCKRPSLMWLQAAEKMGVSAINATEHNGETVEGRLYGQGQDTLDMAASKQQTRRVNLQQKYINGENGNSGDQSRFNPRGSMGTISEDADDQASGTSGMPRPRLETEGSNYFPSLLNPDSRLDPNSDSPSKRNRLSFRSSNRNPAHPWEKVKLMATETERSTRESGDFRMRHVVSDGIWRVPSPKRVWKEFWKQTFGLFVWTAKSSDLATDLMARDSTFAVVTFTSRQAAIAARKCLADGRGAGRWTSIDDLPVPPLADASALNICDRRGCCLPVTVTLNDHQKVWRHYAALIVIGFIYVGYTYPITVAATFGSKHLETIDFFPDDLGLNSDGLFGFIRAQLINLFLMLCPHMFLFVANAGSNATSVVRAEDAALKYYWWFFLLFALLGSSVLQMVLRMFQEGAFNFQDTLEKVADTIPSQVSSNWTNWIVLKITIFHPLVYLLQLPSFLTAALNLKCCHRLVRGGGAGNRVPYRWYVESGMVLMLVLALAPAAPIVAPFAVMYFTICNPILRHVLIFTYKPHFDAGGIRFVFLFDMVISSMLVGQALLSVSLFLKNAGGAAVAAILLSIPTIIFRGTCRKRFLGAYQDAALLQTSLLDGWDHSEDAATSTAEGREEFRRFLVDSHKAAYVPVCMAGIKTDKVLTAEPAVAIPAPTDTDYKEFASSGELPQYVIAKAPSVESKKSAKRESFPSLRSSTGSQNLPKIRKQQTGAVMRRTLPAGSHNDAEGTSKECASAISSVKDGSAAPVRVVSLGQIREGANGEMVVVEKSNGELVLAEKAEVDKDK